MTPEERARAEELTATRLATIKEMRRRLLAEPRRQPNRDDFTAALDDIQEMAQVIEQLLSENHKKDSEIFNMVPSEDYAALESTCEAAEARIKELAMQIEMCSGSCRT